MRAFDVIYKKRNGGKLTEEEINFFVSSFTAGGIPDYQAAAFLMAVFFSGMDSKETFCLTQAMKGSGETWDLSSVAGIKVDKHSTGGIGDGISLALAPLVASCGVVVPMMSGRGLAHTGGTLDKLESIPGFRVNLGREEFIRQLGKIGAAMIGQTSNIAPADKKLYALRDVTATVESMPLITASILSKKLAEGSDAIVFDVKMGNGAFMQDRKAAARLAGIMVNIMKRSRKKAAALITDMNEPLGEAVGNALEMEQAIEILKGVEKPGTKSFIELTEILGGWMLYLGEAAKSPKEGKAKIRDARVTGKGIVKFKEIVEMQGGNPKALDEPKKILPQSKKTSMILSRWKGTVSSMNSRDIGVSSMILGAGRKTLDSPLDLSAGIMLLKKSGDSVERGEPLAEFHYCDESNLEKAENLFISAVKVGKTRPKPRPLVYEVIR